MLLSRVSVLSRQSLGKNVGAFEQIRHLNLHEYQSKALMEKYGVRTQKFKVASTPEEAEKAARDLKVNEIVFKAQIHAGGRGKGHFTSGLKGGVHLSKDPKVVGEVSKKMLGYNLITKQTPPEGSPVRKVMVAEALDIARETYFAILMDRGFGGPVMVASPEGGVDIEAVAEKTPHLIFKEPIDIKKGVQPAQTRKLAEKLGFKGSKIDAASEQMQRLYKLFIGVDATQVEINPFGETPQGEVVCFDAKINFDDNAEFRQKDVFAQRDFEMEDPREAAAAKFNLNYIGMEGNIGCLVNGAGLAMATMDIIKLYGGTPANFLDVGGGASEKAVTEAFKIITSDKQVKGILVNIFGGIMKCDTIANGVVAAAREVKLGIPLIVRLEGTNVKAAKEILAKSTDVKIISADDLDDAAKKAVAAIKKH